MKFIKISMVILVLGVITNIAIVKAVETRGVDTPELVYVYEELKRNEPKDMSVHWKKVNEANQLYSHGTTETTMTKPCPKCQIKVFAKNEIGGATSAAITVMGQQKYLETGGYAGMWYLNLQRFDSTLLTTKTGGTWTLNGK